MTAGQTLKPGGAALLAAVFGDLLRARPVRGTRWLRSYATEQTQANDSPDERSAALRRTLDHYPATAAAALLALNGRQRRKPWLTWARHTARTASRTPPPRPGSKR